ncbi:MAG TPA: hypothetical protein VMS96_07190 [Terriglobales bacterium]|nr:hypothetical protein [Terriglobales bacterium]
MGLCALLLSGLAAAQSYPSNYPPPSNYPYSGPGAIPEGTRFVVRLKDKLESNKVKPGKKFKAELMEDLTAPNGQVIPRGKKLKGHVSSVDSGFHARMILSFDEIDTNHGGMPIAATVTSVPGEHGVKPETGAEGEISRTGVDKRRAAEGAAIGAAVGTATGAVAGGGKGAVIGAVAGAGVGLGASVLTGRELVLQKGQQLELRLDRPLTVPTH